MNIHTRLTSIKINEIATNPRRYNPEKSEDLSTRIRFHTDAKALNDSTLSAEISVIVTQNNKRILLLTLTGLFYIRKREWKRYINRGRLVLPKPLLVSIYSLLYENVRGAITLLVFKKKFESITLPILDLEECIEEEEHIFNLSKIAPPSKNLEK